MKEAIEFASIVKRELEHRPLRDPDHEIGICKKVKVWNASASGTFEHKEPGWDATVDVTVEQNRRGVLSVSATASDPHFIFAKGHFLAEILRNLTKPT